MPKYVPEIRISAAEHVRRESAADHVRRDSAADVRRGYESHSECGMSDVATDCEVLEASYSRKPKASSPKVEIDDDVLLTDIDGSSDDEKETVIRYPIDCINNMLDLGMSCEEVSSSQGPSKKQKSITCSLEKSRPRMLNDRFDDGGTDIEGMYMSEEDEEYKIDSDVDLGQFEPQAYVSVSDKIITGTIISPRVTPEPGAAKKKRSSTLRTPVPISSVLTDTEMIISDTESNTTRSKRMTRVRPFKTIFDGFTSDTEDSDASVKDIAKTGTRLNKKITCSRSFDTFKQVSVIKNSMLAPIRKKGSDCEQSLTDTEHIYVDDRPKYESKHSRPSVIKVNQPYPNQRDTGLRYRQNVAKPKHNQVNSQVSKNQEKSKKTEYALNVPEQEDTGNATDIEAFGSDSDSQAEDVKPVAYLPNARCEMVIDNESHKGKMSIILPITSSHKNKILAVEDLDCGYSDVEDLPGYEPEEYFRCPTPEVPRHTYMTEHSLVENKETVIDKWKLAVENVKPDPVTDTEELDLLPAKSQLKVRIPPRSRNVSECHTDVEDLDDNNDNTKTSLGAEELDPVVLTDVGDFSSEDSDDYIYRFTAVTPDLELNDTYTQARESMSPFSIDVKKRMNESIPKIRTICPSPIPRNHTDTEDFVASQESAGSNWDYSDDGHIEPHSSVIHIKHTKKFNERAESDHIKGFVSRPDPTTDVEELTMMEALEVLAEKKRKQQKAKELNEGTVKICYSGPRGQKVNSRGYKSSGKHDHSKGAGKSKEAVDSSWLSQREGESVERGLGKRDINSPYDNIGGIYYKEINDQTVYPPHLGYSEFEIDILGSNSSLAPGTDTFSELLFSSSNSESEEPDDNFLISKEQETCGILYDMSSHINKVPAVLAKAQTVCRDSPEDSLESRLKYYHELCNRSLSPEIQGVSPAERAELQELEESISQMLIDIRREERVFYNDTEDEAMNTIKRRPRRKCDDERYLKINDDGETALKEIESHISKLLQDVEKEEREVMGSLRRDFKTSMEGLGKGTWEQLKSGVEKLKEDEDAWGDFKKSLEKLESPWDMINATDAEAAQVQYVPFRDSSYTPSPVESSSTSEDEYDIVPKVQLNIGNRLGKSTIDISVRNSPKRKTKMTAAQRSLNRSLPSLKSSSVSLWRDHNSTECLLEPWQPPVWQTTSVEYIAPPDHIEPDSGYCIWSYPDEEPYGNEPKDKDEKAPTTTADNQATAAMKITDKEISLVKKSGTPISERPPASKKDSDKQISPQKSIEQTKKAIQKQKSPSPEKEIPKKQSPSPEKDIKKKKSPSPEKKRSLKDTLISRKSSEGKSSAETKVKAPEKTEEKGKTAKEKKGESKQQEIEEKLITKKSVESPKSPSPEKKTGLLGKTLETIKKPFQEKSDSKAQKDNRGKGKGKGKTTDSVKSNQGGSAKDDEKSGKPQTREAVPVSEEKLQQKEPEKEMYRAQSDVKSDQTLTTSLVEKNETGWLANTETSEKKEAQPNAQGTILEKQLEQESLLQKISHEVPLAISEISTRIEETEESAKYQGKGHPESVEHQKSREKDDSAEVNEQVKETDKPLKGEESSPIRDTKKEKSDGKNNGKKNDKKSHATAKAQEKMEEGIGMEGVKAEVAIKLGEKKESPQEQKSKGKDKVKDKQGSSVETKSQKSGATFVGKAVEAIKKPFQDQGKKSAETKTNKNGGKSKKQKSIDSTRSSSEEKEKTAEPSQKLIDVEKSSEEKVQSVNEPVIKESKESIQKNKGTDIAGKDKAKKALPEQPAKTLEITESKSPEKQESKLLEKTKETSPEKTSPKSIRDQAQKAASKPEKDGSKSPTKEETKKGKGKNKQKSSPASPIPELEKEIKQGKQGKKQVLEKQPTIEKAVEIVTRTFIDQPDDHKADDQQGSSVMITSKTEKLIKELSEEESGQEIEGKPIELVTKPFGRSKTDHRDTKTEKLIKELSIEKSGEIIEKGAIDIVAKPLQDFKSSTGTNKARRVDKTPKDEFEHIQQTIDDAKSKLDQFKGIVTDEASRQKSRGKEDLAMIEKTGEHTLKQEPIKTGDFEQYSIERTELAIGHTTAETAAAEAVDSVLREAQKDIDDTMQRQIKAGEEGIVMYTNEAPAALDSFAQESQDKADGFKEGAGKPIENVRDFITGQTDEISIDLTEARSVNLEPYGKVGTETVKQVHAAGPAIVDKHIESGSKPVIQKGATIMKETTITIGDRTDKNIGVNDKLSKTLYPKDITIPATSSIGEPENSKDVVTTGAVENSSDDRKVTVSKETVEAELMPRGAIVVKKATAITSEIVEDVGQAMEGFGTGMVGKLSGKKGKGKNKAEAPKQQTTAKADVKTSSETPLPKTTESIISGSTTKTIESSKPGNVTKTQTADITKDIAGTTDETVRGSGQEVVGKISGKKAKGKAKMEAAKQTAVSTTGTAAVDIRDAAETTKEKVILASQNIQDSAGSALYSINAETLAVTEELTKAKENVGTVIKGTADMAAVEEIRPVSSSKGISGGVGDAFEGFKQDAMGKLSGKKAKGKQKIEAGKEKLETTAAKTTSEVEALAESTQQKLEAGKQKLETTADKTQGEVKDKAESAQQNLEAGKQKLETTVANITSEVKSVSESMQEKLEAGKQKLDTTDVAKKTIEVKAAAESVQQKLEVGKQELETAAAETTIKAKPLAESTQQNLEAGKRKLETCAQKNSSEVKAATESTHVIIKSTGQKVADTAYSEIQPQLAVSKKIASMTVTELTDEGVGVAGRTVEATFKPVEGAVKKATVTTKELMGHIGDGTLELGQRLVQKGMSTDKVDEEYEQVITTLAKLPDEGVGIAEKIAETFKPLEGAVQKTTVTTKEIIGHPGDGARELDQGLDQRGEHAIIRIKDKVGTECEQVTTEVSATRIGPELHAQTNSAVTFETLESNLEDKISSAASSTDEIGRIIKEMESQLLKTKFEEDESATEESSEVESEDLSRECRTTPATPLLTRKGHSSDLDYNSDVDSTPVVTTPTLSRRVTGIGGSQRLTPAERPVVRVITEYVGDLHESEPEDDITYTVLEPEVRERRTFKIRFSPDMYDRDEKGDADIVEVDESEENSEKCQQDYKAQKKIKHIEKKFERMTSQTKEADPSMTETTNNEFQRIVSQLSLEDMDQALHQWDMGGLTPSEVDSKDLTLSSEETTSPLQQGLIDIFRPKLSSILPTPVYVDKSGTELGRSKAPESTKMKLSLVKDSVPQIFQSVETDSNIQEGSHTLEPGETGETPPIPSPRSPLRLTDSQDSKQETDKPIEKNDDDSKNYASRKMFWEQLSTGSTETPPNASDVPPPVPKPRVRSSISQSIDIPDENKVESHLDASTAEASEIGKQHDLQGITTTDSVARGLTKERTFSVDGDTNSEVEFLRTHDKEDVSYDNDAFDDDTPQHSPFPEPRQRKTTFERSVSLPGDTTIDSANSVRAKKKIFEAQIKKEMVVEQLISQMEEEGSPERKSFDTKDQEPADQEAMLNRQIHSEIVSHELEEQIESNLLENKALVEKREDSVIYRKETKGDSVTRPRDKSIEHKETPEIDRTYETKITSTMAEVLHYKTEAITKPSDSLEVHVDKSELEDTEKVKEIEEELKVIEEKYDSQQQQPADKAKVSSIPSSQGESEDTFSESDVTPEDARFKEQLDIQVYGPSEKDTKLGINKTEEQRRQRSVHTPEEHIPDTVWEVPVQESLESVETETVGQLPSIQQKETLTEKEARNIAEIVVEEIENEMIDRDESKYKETTIKLSEKIETTKKGEQILKLVRTDTTTSSMEITDEDLRSSGMTDNSPLESQIGIIGTGDHADVFGEDSGDDIDAQELDKETIGKDVVDKTLAEVKQSLEAAKEELIEEKKKKRDSITKESPSEFEFKAMVLEKAFTESIQEHHQEETTILERKVHSETRGLQGSKSQNSEIMESSIKAETISHAEVHEQEYFSQKTTDSVMKQKSEMSTEHTILTGKGGDKIDNKKDSLVQSQVDMKDSKIPLSTTGSEISMDSSSSRDTVIEREVTRAEDSKPDISKPLKDTDSVVEVLAESEERKSPLEDVFSTSSSSDYKGGSNEASTLDKPSIAIRKHKKSSFKDPKSDGEMYSSSGSHYESFEQTSESIRTPGSRPLSSDIEGLIPNITGVTTGSSEYESAMSHEISGQSTTITSKDYQTAVSSLSSRDSMKSLDSESSGNLASIEVSSEASETLVPSAMELEKDSEEPVLKRSQITPIQTEDQIKMQSFSESIEQSVSFDISEDISEDDDVQVQAEVAACMKRSHEMTFQPEPRPIVLEEESAQALNTSLDDMSSLVSSATDTGAMKTVRELSKTESERMDGSATSEQLSLTVSATSDVMSLSDSKEMEDTTVISKADTIATQSIPTHQSAATVQSVTMTTTSVVEHGIQSVCTQVTSIVDARETSHSNGPTQVDYNPEYDEGDHEVKKRGHRRNGSTSFRPSMIPVFHGRETKKKPDDIVEDSAESDKYKQPLTMKEGTQEEKKDIDETEKLDEESFKTEADQAMNRDLREGRISIGECGAQSISMDSTSMGSKSRLPSTAFSEADSEIAELLKQCSSDIPSEDPIERPKTPEPVEECELKDDTPEFSSEAQASVTELEMEYSGAFSRSAEYAAHVSPIMEKELSTQESWEHIGSEQVDEFIHSSDPLHLGFDDAPSEKHELETQEIKSKDKPIDRSKSPVPDITVTHHHPASCPTPQDSFEKIDMEPEPPEPDTAKAQEAIKSSGGEAEKKPIDSDKDKKKNEDAASESPTSDSFELLEKPDLADEFVIIEEVGREASEQDTEGKSVRIDKKRVTPRPASSSAPPPIESPPTTITKMTQIKYFSSGATEEEIPFDFDSGSPAKSTKSGKESSQEGSPPSADEPEFKPELEASKKWMEMQFQGEPVAQIYGYDEYERGPLEDIKEEDINELEGSMNSKIGSMGSQVSQSIGSYGSVNSSTPDYDVLAGRKYFTRSGEHDDISMNSLQEFERLEHLLAMESGKHSKSLGSQDSLTSSSNSRKQGSRSGGDDISLASLKEFEGLESACIAAEGIEKRAKEEETLLSEIEEGHESQASESESCVTISAMQRGESDEDDYERRMFEIDEIIRQAQTNVEQFMDSKSREMLDGGLKSETLGRADSLEEISKVPELDLDQPIVSYSSGKSYIQQWEDLGDDLITSTDSLELKTQKSKTSAMDPFTTSTDSLEVKISQDVMSVSTDSIEAAQKAKKKDIMTDSIEIGERSSMITSADSLEGKVTQANSIDDDELHATGIYDQSSSSGKEGDFSSSGKEDSAEGAVGLTNRMPPPRAEYLLGSTDSLEPTSSTATHATYHYETDSVMSSSFTSGDSTTMVDDNDEESAARASIWFDEGKPYVTEVIEPIIGDEEFSHVVHRKVEMPPEIHKVSFKGQEAEAALRDYIEKFDPGEDCTETREVDEHGNVHVKRIIQKRVILRPDVLGGNTTDLSGPELEKYLQTLTQSQLETEPPLETIHTESHSTVTTLRTTTTLNQGETIKTEQDQKQTVEPTRRGSRPPLKYDISVDEEPEYDPREHDWRFNLPTHLERDEDTQDGAAGYTQSRAKGSKQEKSSKK